MRKLKKKKNTEKKPFSQCHSTDSTNSHHEVWFRCVRNVSRDYVIVDICRKVKVVSLAETLHIQTHQCEWM